MLATRLQDYANRPDVLVLALPRGGVVTGFQVAKALRVPLDVLVVRKLGVPDQPEVAMGAIGIGGFTVLNEELIDLLGLTPQQIESVARVERAELERREKLYRSGRPVRNVAGKTVLLVDDGIATGATMRAAIATLQRQHPAKIVVAVPTADRSFCINLSKFQPDCGCVCLMTPQPFYAVGNYYRNFVQTTDGEVTELLAKGESAALL